MLSLLKIRHTTIKARVFRAETGIWEDLGVIWKTKGRLKNFKDKVLLWLLYLRRLGRDSS